MSVKNIHPRTGLKGEITIPGDKSISHRSVMFGSIALGTTKITNFLKGADCLSTIGCFRKMGIQITEESDSILVYGKGLRGLSAPTGILNVGNSGTTTRLMSGILAGQSFTSVMSGDESLNSRPMGRIMTPLNSMGAHICSIHNDNCAPLKLEPGALHGIHYQSPVASAQIKSAVLLAGLYADGDTSVTEPALSRNHTELMLQSFGADVSSVLHEDGSATARIRPCKELYGQTIHVPGDISSAAYFIAAGLIVPGSELLIKNVGTNPTRAGILRVCEAMGADITYVNCRNMDSAAMHPGSGSNGGTSLSGQQCAAGEPTADILVRSSLLHGTTISGSLIPTLIDEIPIIAVMAACAEGTTIIKNAAELKVKETNRIDTVTANLRAMGVNITPTEDGMIIEGGASLYGARLKSYLDHRIAMAFAIAGLIAQGETIIEDSQCVDVSYPEFFHTLEDISDSNRV